MRSRMFIAAIAAVAAAGPSHAQAVIETPKQTIEVIGLHRWTVRMIQDSLDKYAPGNDLTAHACAAILRGKLHFADASVGVFMGMTKEQTKPYVAITLIEPSDSALIHYRPAFTDSLSARADYAAAYAAFRSHSETAQLALQSPSFYSAVLSPADSARFEKVRAIHDVLMNLRSAADFETAVRTLDTDGSTANRTIAAIVLADFADRDSAWWTLTDALRDPNGGPASGTASQVLRTMALRAARPVDWAPMADRLRYIVDGTNLFAFDDVLRTLTATGVSPSLVPALLGGGGGTMVRAKLHSNDQWSKSTVAAFLAKLGGPPSSAEPAAFDAWLDRVTVVRVSNSR